MESFWATLKTELVHDERYAAHAAARASIFEYIEVFYNRKAAQFVRLSEPRSVRGKPELVTPARPPFVGKSNPPFFHLPSSISGCHPIRLAMSSE